MGGWYKQGGMILANKRIPLIGVRFGKLEVVELQETDKKCTYYRCKCECGGEIVARSNDLISGRTKSCGCLRRKAYARNKYLQKRSGLL